VLAAALLGGTCVWVKAAEELTKEQSQELDRRAMALNREALQLFHQGQYATATKRLQQALATLERLYPRELYPQGHLRLAGLMTGLGILLKAHGEYGRALDYHQKALAMYQRLYPKGSYRQGHPHLAAALKALGLVLDAQGQHGRALDYHMKALAMYQRLYPTERYPQGHPHLANSLNDVGAMLQAQGEDARAVDYYQQALAMRERLYPMDLFPQGHPDLAASLNTLGALLYARLEYTLALDYLQKARAMYARLYPRERYPQGHPDWALCLYSLGGLLAAQGEYTAAFDSLQKALAMYERLYPRAKHPQGHADIANCVNGLGTVLQAQGEFTRALEYFQKALAMRERLYPTAKYPRGHADLANSLNNLGGLLGDQGEYGRARGYYQKALAMHERLYPKERYPQGHPSLANSVFNLGALLKEQAQYGPAQDYLQKALAMRESLYPKARYPNGHPELAASLNSLGFVLAAQGERARALDYFQKALAMRERLYPRDRYPQGHRDLAVSLNNLANQLHEQEEYARALDCHQKALAIYERLFPRERYPQGHPNLAGTLHDLGSLLDAQGEYARAQGYYQKALAMRERLYPRKVYPHGHPELAHSLNALGTLLHDQGEYARAQDYYRKALGMTKRLYPKDRYPQGHPDLAVRLTNLGCLLRDQGDFPRACDHLHKALAMYQDLTDVFSSVASEAEAFSRLASLPRCRDGLLSFSRHVPRTEETVYGSIWRSKGAITRILERRQQAVMHALFAEKTTRPERQEVTKVWQQLQAKRRALARLLLAPSRDAQAHQVALQKLAQEKVDLERDLAKLFPNFARQQELERKGYDVLVKKLPAGTVFIDLLHYVRMDQNPKRPGREGYRRTECYVAFILAKDQPVKRVEMNQAKPIDDALESWRTDIQAKKTSSAPEKLHRLVWEPLARHIPSGAQTILVAPDGAISRLPWAALPVNKEGRVVLEDYAFALVPHGSFLLERLNDPALSQSEAGLLLAVGAVQYDAPPPAAARTEVEAMNRAAELGDRKVSWYRLPATGKELDQVVALAGKRTVHRLTGAQASTTRLVAELPEARWVHLATHGFFADKKFRSILQIDERLFDRRAFREGPPPGARNPLVLSGLVLAGANRPLPEDLNERTESDGGILTAEAIASLPLHQMELVVLSACETGLGEVAGGEGVFGLQRAFHQAGARNVVASLWKVDDQATAALMALFYDKLWRQNKPAIVALREAQLTLYHHPERIGVLAKERGPNFDKVVRLPAAPKEGKKPDHSGKPSTKLWAGFVVSGLGR
jgi:CHAT domain-containing protein/Tfp pilus assembly protein PilF